MWVLLPQQAEKPYPEGIRALKEPPPALFPGSYTLASSPCATKAELHAADAMEHLDIQVRAL